MNNNFIPQIFKEKINQTINILVSLFFVLFSIALILSIWTFNIEDNSFLTSTSSQTTNLLGSIGSYVASFLIYAFGFLSYLVAIFFLVCGVQIFFGKHFKYFFIRLFGFCLCLVLIPQTFMFWDWRLPLIEQLPAWGNLSLILFLSHEIEILSYVFTLTGVVLFILSLNLLYLIQIDKWSFKISKTNKHSRKRDSSYFKKEPIINTSLNISRSQKPNYQSTNNSSNKEVLDNNMYSSPSLEILDNKVSNLKNQKNKQSIQENSELLENVFADFNIEIKVVNVKLGPVVTLYEILPAAGIKINTIINLADDISRSMGVGAVRIAQIYGTQFLGVEVPNEQREAVTIKELLSNDSFKSTSHKIPLCVGKDISGNIEVIDLSKTPHLLVAGTTGSGKSVFINTLLASLLYKFSPDQLKLILIDPKMLELSVYNDIAHLLAPVVTEPKKAIITLKWVCKEMERRYSMMNEEGTRSLEGYNQQASEKLPYIVVFIDEMADLMMTAGKEVEHYVQRLAQMARACGIHLVMATQRPSVDIITGSIKANFPSRISFQVASKYDSRTILGEIGAEQLLGNGDMLMTKNGGNIIRYQSAFISDKEVNKLIKEIKQNQKVEYLEELTQVIANDNENYENLSEEDEALIIKSIELIKTSNKASTSFLQRNFQIGYNKAARIMEALEQRGVVSEPNHTGKRTILD